MADIDLDKFLAQREEARAKDDVQVYKFDFDDQTFEKTDGDTFAFKFKGRDWVVREPQFLTDAEKEQLDPLTADVDVAAWYMGETQYEEFLAAGGESWMFNQAFTDYSKKIRDELQGKPYSAESLIAPRGAEEVEAALDATYPGLCDPARGIGVLARFHRGEITLRKLRVLIENLPQGVTAIDQARSDGQRWGWNEQMLWMLVRLMQIQTASISNRLGKPKVKVPKEHPKYPWIDVDEDAPKQFGSRGDHSSEEVMSFLDSL
ncbi:tail assembly chaperone [Gordonia phage William]|uniref:Tail assembly chaperone n=1 Tax=Gordonia phage William TaxID=2571253 RepID=A0A4Y6EIE7_9CAUD|nr:tail assembly chaperone [Gordonia phage William]QDF17111.1 tail assembly chaperone [Gordonia phage William]